MPMQQAEGRENKLKSILVPTSLAALLGSIELFLLTARASSSGDKRAAMGLCSNYFSATPDYKLVCGWASGALMGQCYGIMYLARAGEGLFNSITLYCTVWVCLHIPRWAQVPALFSWTVQHSCKFSCGMSHMWRLYVLPCMAEL